MRATSNFAWILVLMTVSACSPSTERSAGRATYSEDQLGASISQAQREWGRTAHELADLREQVQSHYELMENAKRSSDPMDTVEADESLKFGLQAVDALERRCQEALGASSMINDISGARDSVDEYIRFAETMRAKFR